MISESDENFHNLLPKKIPINQNESLLQPGKPKISASEAFSIILGKAGDFGKFQILLTITCGFCGVFTAFHNIGAVFLAATPEHFCKNNALEKLERSGNESAEEPRNLSISRFAEHDGILKLSSRCEYLSAANYLSAKDNNYSKEELSNNTMQNKCDSWVYDTDIYQSTVVSEWNLVCDQRWLMSTTQSSFMMGLLAGAVIFSAVSDKIGRRKSSLICACFILSSSVLASFSTSFVMFLILRFILAASGQGMFLVNYVLVVECVSLKGRNVMGNLYHLFFSIGFVILPLLAYFIRDWRMLQLACSVPTVLLLGYFWFLPESPRWLLLHNRKAEGLKVLQYIASVNKRELPKESDHDFMELLDTIFQEGEHKTEESFCRKIASVMGNAMSLIRTPNIRRRSLIMCYAWFVVSMIYYGLTFSGSNIDASPYTTVALSGAIEFPAIAVLILLLLKCGRRPVLCGALLLAGCSCTAIVFVPKHMVWLNLTLATFGKFLVSLAFYLVFIFSSEMVPTHVRNISMGIASMWARIGSGLAPYMVDLLGDIYYAMPSTLFGGLAILSGLLCLLLPETGNHRLPESIEEIESMVR